MLRSILRRATAPRRWDGQVMVDVCMVPMGQGVSVRNEVTEVERLFREKQKQGILECQLHAYGTNISGSWDDVMGALREAHELLHDKLGVVRITSSIRMGTRTDKSQSMEDKVAAVEQGLAKPHGS
mmetsp:Transcript_1468/g.2263  ORF Transcript_1468/g.2263 Transcript_1468/m.2263 type:complete len:126 (-) Transcript_1468:189-566(-)